MPKSKQKTTCNTEKQVLTLSTELFGRIATDYWANGCPQVVGPLSSQELLFREQRSDLDTKCFEYDNMKCQVCTHVT